VVVEIHFALLVDFALPEQCCFLEL